MKSYLFILLFLAIPFSCFGEEKELEKEKPQKEEKEEKPQKEKPQKEEKEKPQKEVAEKEENEKTAKKGPKHIPVGNFALPTSQQIAPLVAFGQLVVGEDVLQYYLTGNFFGGNKTFVSILTPGIVYGITEEVDVYLQLPFSPGNFQDKQCSAGVRDILLQAEYAYYTCETCCYTNQATIVANITYPTGDPCKNPSTGFGAPSFFIGGTLSHVDLWWYGFLSAGAHFPTENHGTKFGDDYLYQFGYERVICAITDQMVFAWMVEFDGTYSKKDRIHGRFDPNSGGNVVFFTPSLWFATRRWIVQGGLGFPIIQNLHGKQRKNDLALFFIIGYNL